MLLFASAIVFSRKSVRNMNKSIVVMLLAMLAVGTFAFIPTLAQADETTNQSLWIRTRGHINDWGTDRAFGWINAHVRMIDVNGTYREWAQVHAAWSTDLPHMNCSQMPTENFTFVHYSARLVVNSSDVALNGTDFDLSITGLWNVTKITLSVYVDENGTLLYVERVIEPYLPELAAGELKVFNNWNRFELSITGMPSLSGFVIWTRMAYLEIKLFDMNNDGKVDIRELARIATRFRLTPGTFNYDHEADVNCDDVIDIGDLTTIAANLEG
jgi:hypothetical protein